MKRTQVVVGLLLAGFILSTKEMRAAFREVFSFGLQEYWCENHLSVADVNGDGRKDIVLMATALAAPTGPPWQYRCRAILLRAQPDGSFTGSNIAAYAGYGYAALAADLNNDRAPDLILCGGAATRVLLNDKAGGFREVWSGGRGYAHLDVSDTNRDGFLDIISGTQTGSGGLIELFKNDGAGTRFVKTWESRLYGTGYDTIRTVLNVNLNNDSYPDIAAREIYTGLLITLHGTAAGNAFVERNVIPLGDRTFSLAAGRVNGDTAADLAVHVGWGRVKVFVNRGDGALTEYWQSPDLGQAAFNLALADFDRDGFDDIFVGTFNDGVLRIYRNNPGVGFDLWWQGSVPGREYMGSAADLNGDGYPDLIVGETNRLRILINQTGNPLSIARDGSDALVSWPQSGSNFVLEVATDLKLGDWRPCDAAATMAAADGWSARVPLTNARSFFRLRRD